MQQEKSVLVVCNKLNTILLEYGMILMYYDLTYCVVVIADFQRMMFESSKSPVASLVTHDNTHLQVTSQTTRNRSSTPTPK